jgi:formate hydrogenlyase subunit 6/NADH:ubiquinone oxidoreductase subunit I
MELLRNVLRNSFRKPITRLYPREVHEPHPGTRGQLTMDPDRCTYCSVCEKRCPTQAIAVTRKPEKSWTLRPHLCILCGYCIEVCPKECLSMDARHRGPSV